MIEAEYLKDVRAQFVKLKELAEKALTQVHDDELNVTLDAESNSIAVIMKHMAGNMRSRWTDFLTTDGEKPDRERDQEFVIDGTNSRAQILATWEDGWSCLFAAISALTPNDLGKKVQIRGQGHTVVEAINRQLIHYAEHVGQIVLLAKHYAGPNWQSLSIPRGKSKEYLRSR
jgi:hypothetical protein